MYKNNSSNFILGNSSLFSVGIFLFLLLTHSARAQTDYPRVPTASIDSIVYAFGQLNEGQFGNNFGSDNHPNGYGVNIFVNDVANSPGNTSLTPCNRVYKLSYKVFDIDFDEEVRIYINNVYTAFITATGNGQLRDRKIEFCGSVLRRGNNLIEFRVEDSTRIWGVEDILLQYIVVNSINLDLDTAITTQYGNGFGTDIHPNLLIANFDRTDTSALKFSITGWDIESNNEVAVYFNDTFIGFLDAGCNQCENLGDTFILDPGSIRVGRNQLAFIQRNANEQWGLTDILLQANSTIVPIINLLLN